MPIKNGLIKWAYLNWLGREDSNLRMAESKSAALPLGYAPMDRWCVVSAGGGATIGPALECRNLFLYEGRALPHLGGPDQIRLSAEPHSVSRKDHECREPRLCVR